MIDIFHDGDTESEIVIKTSDFFANLRTNKVQRYLNDMNVMFNKKTESQKHSESLGGIELTHEQ